MGTTPAQSTAPRLENALMRPIAKPRSLAGNSSAANTVETTHSEIRKTREISWRTANETGSGARPESNDVTV